MLSSKRRIPLNVIPFCSYSSKPFLNFFAMSLQYNGISSVEPESSNVIPSYQSVNDGQHAIFKCFHATTVAMWIFNGIPRAEKMKHLKHNILVIENADFHDSGKYACLESIGDYSQYIGIGHLDVLGILQASADS